MSISFPFNFQPVSISVQSGAYTIPAGYYAYVSVSCDPSAVFLVNGAGAIYGYSRTYPVDNGTGGASTATDSAGFSNSYWFPAGTVLDTSGSGNCRYVVTLYPNIS